MADYRDLEIKGCMPDDITEDEIEDLVEKGRAYLLNHGGWNIIMKIKKNSENSQEHEHKKINLRTLNVILKRSIFIAKKTYYFNLFLKYSSNIKNACAGIRDILAKKRLNVTPANVKIGNIL